MEGNNSIQGQGGQGENVQPTDSDEEQSTVNLGGNLPTEVNSPPRTVNRDVQLNSHEKGLSLQMKRILEWLYIERDRVHSQREIITGIYGKITYNKIISVNRSVNSLIKRGLIESRKQYYSDKFNCWMSHRIKFYITDIGEEYIKKVCKNLDELDKQNEIARLRHITEMEAMREMIFRGGA